MFIDRFGREIADNGDGTFTAGGITITQATAAEALNTFNAMAPEDWTPPEDEK